MIVQVDQVLFHGGAWKRLIEYAIERDPAHAPHQVCKGGPFCNMKCGTHFLSPTKRISEIIHYRLSIKSNLGSLCSASVKGVEDRQDRQGFFGRYRLRLVVDDGIRKGHTLFGVRF